MCWRVWCMCAGEGDELMRIGVRVGVVASMSTSTRAELVDRKL